MTNPPGVWYTFSIKTGGVIMGMSDRQFDSYKSIQVDLIDEILENSEDYETLKRKIKEFNEKTKEELKRP